MFKQNLQQKVQQKLSPKQIQFMQLVQLPVLAFEERLHQEIEENPVLESCLNEEGEHSDELSSLEEDAQIIDVSDVNIDSYLSDDDLPDYRTHKISSYDKIISFSTGTLNSFYEHLKQQLHGFKLSDKDVIIVDFILGNLDEDGYLRRNPEDLSDDITWTTGIKVDKEKVNNLLVNCVQKLYPLGIGAKDLKECLLIQIQKKPSSPSIDLAKNIILLDFESFSKKHYEKLRERYHVTYEMLRKALYQIERLDPKPGKTYANLQVQDATTHIVPDFLLNIVNGELEISLTKPSSLELRISPSYVEMFRSYQQGQKSFYHPVRFIKQKLDAAKWFLDAVKHREQTLLLTMNAIIDYQKEYFLSGDKKQIRPMVLKDIAININMDISTISRVVNSKYLETPYGLFLLKDFFSDKMINQKGEEISTIEIRNILSNFITQENKKLPFTDEKLTTLLREKGYHIARRTVSKYREQLNIPVARLRKFVLYKKCHL
ncbi:RNA polymerase factor sigma-54 [Candidatus Walczuchella monophlebidarum]|uniref:RNA polymerase sigma 54 subunit n=1 Tax=Candidatus Walczuchella monophlebidarum TaxID=1415657 RepID=A0A068DP61_9FLAO|nr:RNA polymerase factor sigma-54 [Candidatus Walczuchella monophlebidarum]AID37535.1 RNA polymerase sigma 54 subunit [Candidatus Walczuchella monophlebidarum]